MKILLDINEVLTNQEILGLEGALPKRGTMPDISSSSPIAALRQSIDALALEIALRNLSSVERIQPLVPMLAQIRQEAKGPAAPATASLNQDPELVGDFILESREHLSAIEGQLLALEQDPGNLEAINAVFRGFHTIKGLAGFLDFPAIQRFAHEVETLLDLARNSKVAVDSGLIDIFLQSADHMNHCLRGVETGREPITNVAPLIASIKIMISQGGAGDSPASLAQLASAIAAPPQTSATELDGAGVKREATTGPTAVKVATGKLDYLVDMIGELVIAQSMILHDPDVAAARSPRLMRNLTQLTRITGDVQRVALAMRMIPVGQLFQRMARLVRDLARKSGKQVNLKLSGEETELDRNMVEELADPLMHMIRNAVDHGAEPPETRVAAGKSSAARIDLKAYHQGRFIHIEISDDGRGLDREKILAKARQRGMVSGGDDLSDQEVFSFIFEPGFSTAEQVTDVSGRGVGMDVVRKHISKLRGRIDISSRAGHGATFLIKLPLTLAPIQRAPRVRRGRAVS